MIPQRSHLRTAAQFEVFRSLAVPNIFSLCLEKDVTDSRRPGLLILTDFETNERGSISTGSFYTSNAQKIMQSADTVWAFWFLCWQVYWIKWPSRKCLGDDERQTVCVDRQDSVDNHGNWPGLLSPPNPQKFFLSFLPPTLKSPIVCRLKCPWVQCVGPEEASKTCQAQNTCVRFLRDFPAEFFSASPLKTLEGIQPQMPSSVGKR